MTRQDTILGNARIVLADRVIERGWVAFAEGRIAALGEGKAPAGSEDAGGDLIMPGLIELHTDHLEMHYVPRPKVFWDPIAAASTPARPSTSSAPSSRQTRSESNTVVMPDVASWPS